MTVDRVQGAIANLLDNLTPTNSDYVDGRIQVLEKEQLEVERRLEELDRLAGSRREITELVELKSSFIEGIESVLRHVPAEQRVTAARSVIERVVVHSANLGDLLVHAFR